ncbi:hypothetical protein DI005_22255 [Prauserella sp. PE36]|nr:hypothetical protein DI005_22255 [Prauserella sp. PE36]
MKLRWKERCVVVESNFAKSVIGDLRVHLVRLPGMTNVFREEAAIVEVQTEDGVSGWAEANGLLLALKAHVEADRPHPRDRGPRAALVGQQFADVLAAVDALRSNTTLSGRSGLGRVANGAIETALFDLAGRLDGVPAWQLLLGPAEGPEQHVITPYITIFNRGSYPDVVAKAKDDIDRARSFGYRHFKIEATSYNTDERQAVTIVDEVRSHVGDSVTLFVDNVYRWAEYTAGAEAAKAYKSLGAEFLEDPFLPEQWEWWRRLRDEVGLPLATGGGMETLERFLAQMEFANTDIVQPGAHVAGLLGAHEVAQAAAKRARSITPFGVSATTLATGGALHLAAANPNVKYIEYAPANLFRVLRLRSDVTPNEPELRPDGTFLAPNTPGIGVDCDTDAIDKYRVSG